MRKITVWLARHYMPPLHGLSFMRIAVALVVIADLIIRWPDIEAFYTDEGIWPRDLARNLGWKGGYWSIHLLSGSAGWQLTLFSIHLLAAVSMLAGWRTVVSTAVTWLLMVSLHNRNVYILQAGDDLLRMTLLFGIFLPWNAHYSVDKDRKGAFIMPASVYVYLAYLLLVASVYFFTVILKSSPEWWSEGTAIYYALSLEQLRLPHTGDWLYNYPGLMRLLTWMVMILEAAIPLLILIPHKRNKTRVAAFFCITALHLGIASTLYVGLFPFIGIASALGLVAFRPAGKKVSGSFFERRTAKSEVATFTGIVAAYCLMINLQGIPNFDYELRPALRVPAHVFRLDQYWGMFSPSVLKLDGWYVYQGVDMNGKEWDLRENRSSMNYSKPAHILSHYANDRWRKLAENLQSDSYTFLRPVYARYILRKWNREHAEKPLQMLNLYYMEKTNLPGYRKSTIRKILYCATDGR